MAWTNEKLLLVATLAAALRRVKPRSCEPLDHYTVRHAQWRDCCEAVADEIRRGGRPGDGGDFLVSCGYLEKE